MRNLPLYLVHLLNLHGILMVVEFKTQNRTLTGYLKFKLKGLFLLLFYLIN